MCVCVSDEEEGRVIDEGDGGPWLNTGPLLYLSSDHPDKAFLSPLLNRGLLFPARASSPLLSPALSDQQGGQRDSLSRFSLQTTPPVPVRLN